MKMRLQYLKGLILLVSLSSLLPISRLFILRLFPFLSFISFFIVPVVSLSSFTFFSSPFFSIFLFLVFSCLCHRLIQFITIQNPWIQTENKKIEVRCSTFQALSFMDTHQPTSQPPLNTSKGIYTHLLSLSHTFPLQSYGPVSVFRLSGLGK